MYAAICYHILTEGNQHPSYLYEKLPMLNEGPEAFAYLDYHNMRKAIEYCEHWHVPVPNEWTESYNRQVDAAKKLNFEL